MSDIAVTCPDCAALHDEMDRLRSELERRVKQVRGYREAAKRHATQVADLRWKLGQQSDAIIELASKLAGVDPTIPVSELVRDIAQRNPTFSSRLARERAATGDAR